VDIKEESPVDVPGTHFPEMGFVPTDMVRFGDVVETGDEGDESDCGEKYNERWKMDGLGCFIPWQVFGL